MRTVIACLGLLLGAAALSGCNTIAGMGKDVQRAGEKIEGAASRNK